MHILHYIINLKIELNINKFIFLTKDELFK